MAALRGRRRIALVAVGTTAASASGGTDAAFANHNRGLPSSPFVARRLIQVLVIAGLLLAMPAPARAAAAAGSARARPPLVMVLFDELPLVSLLDGAGQIDAVRYPNFAAFAGGASWFPDATAAHDSSLYAVPAILTGRYPRRRARRDYCFHRNNLFTLLHSHGYAIDAVESETSLWPPHRCGGRPRFKPMLKLLFGAGRPGLLERWWRRIRPRKRPVFYFQHTFLPHLPWQYLPSGRTYGRLPRYGGPSWAPGLTKHSEAGLHDRYLARLAYERHLLQVGFVDRLLGRMVAHLRARGIYSRALIVITADHGIAFHLLRRDRRRLTRANAGEVAEVPLLIKLPGQRRGQVLRGPAEAVDVLPTIARILRIRPRGRLSGRAELGGPRRRRRIAHVFQRSWHELRLSAGELHRSRAAAIRRKLRVFGSGHRALYRPWRNRALLGQPLRNLVVRRSARLRAAFWGRRWLRGFSLASGFVPALVSGVMHGGGRREHELALAVDGTVVATGKSYHLRARRQEFFGLLAPESAFHPGTTRIDLLSVRGKHRLRLARLGHVGP